MVGRIAAEGGDPTAKYNFAMMVNGQECESYFHFSFAEPLLQAEKTLPPEAASFSVECLSSLATGGHVMSQVGNRFC